MSNDEVLEKQIEDRTVAYAEHSNILIVKFGVIGRRGWPDRLLLGAGGHAEFIEFKRPGNKPDPLQRDVIEQLRDLGFACPVIDNEQAGLGAISAFVRKTL